MDNLYKNYYNKDQWKVKGSRDKGFSFVNKDTLDSYHIAGDIISFMQVEKNEFLIYSRIERYRWQLERVQFVDSMVVVVTKMTFGNLAQITDDYIIFDDGKVYSISKNAYVEEASWIRYKNFEVLEDELTKKCFLFIEERIGGSNYFDQVIIDVNTFKPITPAYSTLRDSFVALTDEYSFSRLEEEDGYYYEYIHDYFWNLDFEKKKKGKNSLIKIVEEKE